MMNKINAIIIEDEKPAAEKLSNMLSKTDENISVVKVFDTVRESVTWLKANSPDLIFLDLQLSDGLALDIFRQTQVQTPVIFTTAYDQYAIEAFKHNSVDYLLKPFLQDDLNFAISKFKKHRFSNASDIESFLKTYASEKPQYKKRWMVHFANRIKSIKTEDIAFFEVINKGVFLRTFSNKSYDLNYSLEKIETKVDPDTFFRVNRKLLANIDAIEEIYSLSKSRIKLKLGPEPEEDALVSFKRTSEFRKWINQ